MVARFDRSPLCMVKEFFRCSKVYEIFQCSLKKNVSLTPSLGVDHNIVAPESSWVTAGGGSLAAASQRRGTPGTAADDHPAIPHAHVNAITLASRHRCFSTMGQCCFRDASLGPNWAAFRVSNYPL